MITEFDIDARSGTLTVRLVAPAGNVADMGVSVADS